MRGTWPAARAIWLLKLSLAAGLSWYLASLVSPHPTPYFAPLAVVIVFQATIGDTVAKAWCRIAGIIGGVAIALLGGHWLPMGAVSVALVVLIGVTICTALRLDPLITSQVGVTAVMVLASSNTPHYAQYRIFESLVGGMVAVAVHAVVAPPNGLPMAEQRVAEVADLLAATLLKLSRATAALRNAMVSTVASEIESSMQRAHQALRSAEANVKLNPFTRASGARLRELDAVLVELEKVGIQVRGISRGLADLPAEMDLGRTGLEEALQDTASSISAFRRAMANPSAESVQEVEVAVVEAHRSQANCLFYLKETESLTELRDLGAILADVDRILSEVRLGLRHPEGEVPVQPSLALEQN